MCQFQHHGHAYVEGLSAQFSVPPLIHRQKPVAVAPWTILSSRVSSESCLTNTWVLGNKPVLGAQTQISCSAENPLIKGGYKTSWVRTRLRTPHWAFAQWRAKETARLTRWRCFIQIHHYINISYLGCKVHDIATLIFRSTIENVYFDNSVRHPNPSTRLFIYFLNSIWQPSCYKMVATIEGQMEIKCKMFDKFEIAIHIYMHWCQKHDSTLGDIFHKI